MSRFRTTSVAMCTYNGERFLGRQLASIAAQTRLPAELVICDDRSTDRTAEVVRNFAESAPFEVRFNVNAQNLGGSSKGITRNFEQASSLCKGDLVAFCDQDDVWLPARLERMVQALEQSPDAGGVFADAELIDDQDTPKGVLLSQTTGMSAGEHQRLKRGEVLPVLLSMTKVYGCSLMVEASLLPKILPVPPHWWFDAWVACTTALYSRLIFLPEPLFQYRIHASQSVGAAVPTATEHIKRWRSSAREYWRVSQPQLLELYARLAAENDPSLERYLTYLQGRMDLLRFRAELSANPLLRIAKILPEAKNYLRYFNGWKSVVKDLTTT